MGAFTSRWGLHPCKASLSGHSFRQIDVHTGCLAPQGGWPPGDGQQKLPVEASHVSLPNKYLPRVWTTLVRVKSNSLGHVGLAKSSCLKTYLSGACLYRGDSWILPLCVMLLERTRSRSRPQYIF